MAAIAAMGRSYSSSRRTIIATDISSPVRLIGQVLGEWMLCRFISMTKGL